MRGEILEKNKYRNLVVAHNNVYPTQEQWHCAKSIGFDPSACRIIRLIASAAGAMLNMYFLRCFSYFIYYRGTVNDALCARGDDDCILCLLLHLRVCIFLDVFLRCSQGCPLFCYIKHIHIQEICACCRAHTSAWRNFIFSFCALLGNLWPILLTTYASGFCEQIYANEIHYSHPMK